jgi:uncharacterized YccA/Bax inhibitor family protein
MNSRNPVLSREFSDAQLATFHEPPPTAAKLQEMYDGPGGPGTGTVSRVMTLDDVVVRSGILFLVLVAAAFGGWQLEERAQPVVWVAALVAFGLAMAVIFKRSPSRALIVLYAAVEGVFLGGISRWYDVYVSSVKGTPTGIVTQAIIGTFVAFAVMLLLYSSGRLRATARFQKMMLVAFVSYGAIALVSLIAALFGVGGGWGFYGVGPLGILLCAVGVALAAFSLVLDFDAIQKGVAAGLPEAESWRAAFGLMVTLVWLYLELLRLLAIINSRN